MPELSKNYRLVKRNVSTFWRVCEACGTVFMPDDERQRFCPRPAGRNESRCAARIRMRKRRAEAV